MEDIVIYMQKDVESIIFELDLYVKQRLSHFNIGCGQSYQLEYHYFGSEDDNINLDPIKASKPYNRGDQDQEYLSKNGSYKGEKIIIQERN